MGRSKDEILKNHIQTLIEYGRLTDRNDGPLRIEEALRDLLEIKVDSWLRSRFGDWSITDLLEYWRVVQDERAMAMKADAASKKAKAPRGQG